MKCFGGGRVIEGHTMVLRRFVRKFQQKQAAQTPFASPLWGAAEQRLTCRGALYLSVIIYKMF